ncbi:hypothetical protein JVT61DRAFT_6250 [Boletus reticuloceps]|uniref:Uncharacterized protein n=1 Tax=Boletus reticuloceps TaxID=495285 RepID=A0A8I2YJL2_9AGAM|nr:hypothetical protein JVT61DRAFT_6250 [Boletus reticuloceps]
MATSSSMVDPLESVQSTEHAPDVHYFFEKCKNETLTCVPCRWLPNHNFIYKYTTANSGLGSHIEKFHLLQYLELAEKHNWPIYITVITSVFSMGYTFKTLCEALKQTGVTTHNLPPPPMPSPQSPYNIRAGTEPSLEDGLPEFSTSIFVRFPIKFIIADDQVLVPNLDVHEN